jgi:hypothetical protein
VNARCFTGSLNLVAWSLALAERQTSSKIRVSFGRVIDGGGYDPPFKTGRPDSRRVTLAGFTPTEDSMQQVARNLAEAERCGPTGCLLASDSLLQLHLPAVRFANVL